MKFSPVTCGILGAGVIAPTHCRVLSALDGVRIRWACDLVPEKAEKLAIDFDIPRTTAEAAEVLADPEVDFVCVCTDHASHVPLAQAALEAGKAVLCEKALASDEEGVRRMVQAAHVHSDTPFGVVFQHRFDSVNRLVKSLVEDGKLGRILTAGVQLRCLRPDDYYLGDAWRGTWEYEGGAVLINQAIHFIDLLVWFMGPGKRLVGTYANLTHADSMETEDTATAMIRFNGGTVGTIEATCSSHLNWEGTVAVHGTEGSIELRNDHPVKVLFRDREFGQKVQESIDAARQREQDAVAAGKSHYGTGHSALIAEFATAVREQRRPFVTVPSAAHTMNAVLGIYRSHKTDGWVDL